MRRALAAAAVLAALVLFGGAGPVGAFPLTNCTLSLQSVAGGSALDTAESGSPDATQATPFNVDWEGSVSWNGTTGSQVIKNNSWHIDVFGLPTPLRGGSDNGDGNQTGSGSVGVKENAPFRFTGLYFVSGGITGQGGSCDGSGWFKVAGDPVGTIPFFVGLGLAVLGLLLLGWSAAGHPVAGIVGGLILGVGVAALLVIYSALFAGSVTPVAVVAAGLVTGILVAVFGRRRSRRSQV